MQTFEIQIDTPAGRSMFLLVTSPNAAEAKLLARDMLLEFTTHAGDRAFIRTAIGYAEVYTVNAQRLPDEAAPITESDYTDGGDYSNGGAA